MSESIRVKTTTERRQIQARTVLASLGEEDLEEILSLTPHAENLSEDNRTPEGMASLLLELIARG